MKKDKVTEFLSKLRGKNFIFFAPAASGKDWILANFVSRYPSLVTSVVSTTTRPRRPSEVDGIAYHFTDNDTFDKMVENGQLLERTVYFVSGNKWQYGLTKDALKQNSINLIVVNPHGIRQIMTHDDIMKNTYIFLVNTPENVRIERYLDREKDCSDKGELASRLEQRLLQDKKDFADLRDIDYLTITNDKTTNFDDILNEIVSKIQRKESL